MKHLILLVTVFVLCNTCFAQCGNTQRLIFPFSSSIAFVIESDQDHNVILASYSSGGNSRIRKSSDYRVSNLSRLVNGGIVKDMSVDSSGNIYVCGTFLAPLSFDDFPGVFQPGPTITSIFVAKLDASLNTIWLKTSSGNAGSSANGSDLISSISVDNNGNCFISGVYQASFIFQGNDYSAPSSTWKSYIAKLNTSNGSIQWFHAQYCESSEPIPLVIADNNGGAYQSTFFYGDYYDLAGTHFQSTHYNSMVFHFNSIGTYDWGLQLKGENFVRGLQLDAQNALRLCGQMGDTLKVQAQSVFNIGYKGLFVGKIDLNGNASSFDRIASSAINADIYMGVNSFRYMPDNTYYITGQCILETNFNGLINPLSPQRETFVTKFSHLNNAIWTQGYGESPNTIFSGGICTIDDCSVISYGSLSSSNQLIFDDSTYQFSLGSNSDFLVEYNAFNGSYMEGPIADTNGGWDPFGQNWTGLNDLELADIQIFPNPNNGEFAISLPKDLNAEVSILNTFSQTVWQSNGKNSQNIQTNLTPGTYFVVIKYNEKVAIKRLLII